MRSSRLVYSLTAAVSVIAAAALGLALPAGADVQQKSPATQLGMTWTMVNQLPEGLVEVGADNSTNAYTGDTPVTSSLRMLCIYVPADEFRVPSGITPDFYNGWARGLVRLTPAVPGTSLTSRTVANGICANNFGPKWRMAEHHDGWYGNPAQPSHWHFWAYGVIPSGTRFWVAINDQSANPWGR